MNHKVQAEAALSARNYSEYHKQCLLQYQQTNTQNDFIELEKSKKMLNSYHEVKLFLQINEHDYYRILNVNANSTPEEIKKNYLKLTMKYHPDKNKIKESSEAFARIKRAYDYLIDNNNRNVFTSNQNSSNMHQNSNFRMQHDDFEELFRTFYRSRNITNSFSFDGRRNDFYIRRRRQQELKPETLFFLVIIVIWLFLSM